MSLVREESGTKTSIVSVQSCPNTMHNVRMYCTERPHIPCLCLRLCFCVCWFRWHVLQALELGIGVERSDEATKERARSYNLPLRVVQKRRRLMQAQPVAVRSRRTRSGIKVSHTADTTRRLLAYDYSWTTKSRSDFFYFCWLWYRSSGLFVCTTTSVVCLLLRVCFSFLAHFAFWEIMKLNPSPT